MKDRALDKIVGRRERRPASFANLMPWRVRNILLVSSLYDSFTFQEDGRLTEMLFSEYLELNLRYAPRIERVSTVTEALEKLRNAPFDLVISMLKVGDTDVVEFSRAVRNLDPEISLRILANNARELSVLDSMGFAGGSDRVFMWTGDVRLFLAIVKSVEDRMNAWHDAKAVGVPCLILVEDNVRFYSSYLPLLYTELVEHTQALMADGLNRMEKGLRMRARPKILLATSWEEGTHLFERYKSHVMGVIVDARFPREGKHDPRAGIDFARMVKEQSPDRPVLMQSSDQDNARRVEAVGGLFIDKRSPTLLHDVQRFLREHLGFGDFQFRDPDGESIATADDLRGLSTALEDVSASSLLYHARRNDFSTWLMARTEFDLARELRPRRVSEFSNPEHLRGYLLGALQEHRDKKRAGVVADFSSATFEGTSGFVRIGTGSLGGKGRGLAFMHSLFEHYRIDEQFPDVDIFVPPTAVIATDVFDEFMERNRLTRLALAETDDDAIVQAFERAALPKPLIETLRTYLTRVPYPLAVRSSSLLEDASYQPFAGVYHTCMIPNNHDDPEVRLQQLCDSIKRIYASTYFSDAKAYVAATSSRLEEEKMAVIVQQVVGRRYGDLLYPNVAGVARSYNFYPIDDMQPEEGIASVVLGLGKTVVDGGRCLRFSPAHPRRLYQFSTPDEALRTAQREFLALDLSDPELGCGLGDEPDASLRNLGLDRAEDDGTLHALGSVYDQDSHSLRDGISRPGARLVTMAGVLKSEVFPLDAILIHLLQVGRTAFSGEVEIEFAANLRRSSGRPHSFGFLQIRPVVVGPELRNVDLTDVPAVDTICSSPRALGHGHLDQIRDLVYVPERSFDRALTMEIASEIGAINNHLREAQRPYVLIGPGRWGSADRWLGIPVSWSQISSARCIVETDMQDIRVAPSQGTHFFQNMTSLGIAYFTVNFEEHGGTLDQGWLDACTAERETTHVRHLAFAEPLEIVISARRGQGVVMKPGRSIARPET
jgi:DNA-binding NarL/FixJ family response regulator